MGNSWVLRADLSFQSEALRQRRAEEGHFLHIKHAALPTARICVNKSILIDGEKKRGKEKGRGETFSNCRRNQGIHPWQQAML